MNLTEIDAKNKAETLKFVENPDLAKTLNDETWPARWGDPPPLPKGWEWWKDQETGSWVMTKATA
jgi:hypothetical protein